MDAVLCLEHGVDAIIVYNHGGRPRTRTSTLEGLPESCAVKGGFRHQRQRYRRAATLKALALGATAVLLAAPAVGARCLWAAAPSGCWADQQELFDAARRRGVRRWRR